MGQWDAIWLRPSCIDCVQIDDRTGRPHSPGADEKSGGEYQITDLRGP